MSKQPCIYILTNKPYGSLYIGVSSHLTKRIWQHKNRITGGFTQKYHLHMLVYYEYFEDMNNAILREKQMKKWKRAWKIRLIESINPRWDDLYHHLI
ncbi:GIY-YIG nuclease family protein [Brenneria tiliae]|uniref:GIY-YIG nuclease family protein n=1 Tax=Brenneria tiliae TaxID=2914984 RepID=UPI002014B6F4|nr:GIY-YIG nuclease family protein [Brenneria tiliae]MCL2896183.1 GIY-YIG nuclease family protein [Brenneria tiliae]MCL2900741.1 GIY-YIG nuclease family protein [Brenneria tiliae]